MLFTHGSSGHGNGASLSFTRSHSVWIAVFSFMRRKGVSRGTDSGTWMMTCVWRVPASRLPWKNAAQ